MTSHPSRMNGASLRWFGAAVVVGVALRLLAASAGHNFDMESWDITARLQLAGNSVYANTYRYPYAPAGIYILAALKGLALSLGFTGIQAFHLLVCALLSCVDAGIGYLLFRYAGLGAACFYLLNPIGILITGYHSQIDNLAVLGGVASCLLLDSPRRFNRLGAAVLLGLSLATKHILFLFPVWVLFGTVKRLSLRSRFAWACAACAVPAAFLAAYALAYPGSIAGIWSHAVQYRGLAFAAGSSQAALLDSAASGLLPMLGLLITAPFTSGRGLSLPVIGSAASIWIICMLALGMFTRRLTAIERLNVYLVGLTLTTPTIADQYLAIPLVACAAVWTARSVWAYTGVGTAFLLLISFSNIGHAWGLSLFHPPSPAPHLLRCICQVPLIFVLGVLLRPLREQPADSKRLSEKALAQ